MREAKALTWMAMAMTPLAVIPAAVAMAGLLAKHEGRLWPVVGEIEWINPQVLEGKTFTWARFEKRRACEFVDLAVYEDLGGEFKRVLVEFEPDSTGQSRPPGRQYAGPWLIDSDALHLLRVVATHRCHPLWLTQTEM